LPSIKRIQKIALRIPKEEIDSPALLIDLAAMEANLRRMADFFRHREARLRPHAKTHKCPTIAKRQLDLGAIGITCAKLGEAEVMAKAGVRDILIANQIIGSAKISRLVNLAQTADVMVAADDAQNMRTLSAAASAQNVKIRVLVEVNIGMGRCGVEPGQAALALAQEIDRCPGLVFAGLMGYEGHLVFLPSLKERTERCRQAMSLLLESKDLIERTGLPVTIVSAGGTGTYAITGEIPGVTEVQAGSYLFMDGRYRGIEGLEDFPCALTLLATVISRPHPQRAIIDAGMKSITHEFGLPQVKDRPGAKLVALAEEHGIISLEEPDPHLKVGDKIELIVSHGCTTINLHDQYYTIRDGFLEAIWPIAARGAFQ
jgi:D-serine deaminase-like pyridoxal phosphate-dependent protein